MQATTPARTERAWVLPTSSLNCAWEATYSGSCKTMTWLWHGKSASVSPCKSLGLFAFFTRRTSSTETLNLRYVHPCSTFPTLSIIHLIHFYSLRSPYIEHSLGWRLELQAVRLWSGPLHGPKQLTRPNSRSFLELHRSLLQLPELQSGTKHFAKQWEAQTDDLRHEWVHASGDVVWRRLFLFGRYLFLRHGHFRGETSESNAITLFPSFWSSIPFHLRYWQGIRSEKIIC